MILCVWAVSERNTIAKDPEIKESTVKEVRLLHNTIGRKSILHTL